MKIRNVRISDAYLSIASSMGFDRYAELIYFVEVNPELSKNVL